MKTSGNIAVNLTTLNCLPVCLQLCFSGLWGNAKETRAVALRFNFPMHVEKQYNKTIHWDS